MSGRMMTFEVETFYNFDTIKSFGIADQYSGKMRECQEKYKDVSLRYNMFAIRSNVFLSVMGLIVQMPAFKCLSLSDMRRLSD